MPYILTDDLEEYHIRNGRPRYEENFIVYQPSSRRRRKRSHRKRRKEYFTEYVDSPLYNEELVEIVQDLPPRRRESSRRCSTGFNAIDGGYLVDGDGYIIERRRQKEVRHPRQYSTREDHHYQSSRDQRTNLPQPPIDAHRIVYQYNDDGEVTGVVGQHPLVKQRREEWEVIGNQPKQNQYDNYDHTYFQEHQYDSADYAVVNKSQHVSSDVSMFRKNYDFSSNNTRGANDNENKGGFRNLPDVPSTSKTSSKTYKEVTFDERTQNSNDLSTSNSAPNSRANRPIEEDDEALSRQTTTEDLEKLGNSSKYDIEHHISDGELIMKEWMDTTRDTRSSAGKKPIRAEKVIATSERISPLPKPKRPPREIDSELEAVEIEAVENVNTGIDRPDFWNYLDRLGNGNEDKKNQHGNNDKPTRRRSFKDAASDAKGCVEKKISNVMQSFSENPFGRFLSSLGRGETCEEFKNRIKNQTVFVTSSYSKLQKPYNVELNLDKLNENGCRRPVFISSGIEDRSHRPNTDACLLDVESDDEEIPKGGCYVRLYCRQCNNWESDSCCGDA